MKLTLLTLRGPTGREWYGFDRFPIRIGRRPDNEISISDPSVSRYHCEIVLRRGALWVADLGSANGILVNDQRVEESEVSDGDEITVGLARFRLSVGDDSTKTDLDWSPEVALSRMHTVVLDPAKAAYLPSAPPGESRAERDLQVLLDLCLALQARLPAGESALRLLESLQKALPYRAGMVVLTEPGTGRVVRRDVLPSDHDGALDVSEALEGRSQIEGGRLTTPLIVNRNCVGAVAVESDGRAELDRQHLNLAAAAAAVTAAAIDNANRQTRLTLRARLLEEERFGGAVLAGDSAAAREVRRRIEDAAASGSPVLIQGPPGIGKEVAARSIHTQSASGEGPFVHVRCLVHTQDELERILFGVESAVSVKPGAFEHAEGGTLLLDRIEGFGPELQTRFLEVLDRGEYFRLGGTERLLVRFRTIVAARLELTDWARTGKFLHELYLRISERRLVMKGLRERPADIPAIATAVAHTLSDRAGRPFMGITNSAMAALTMYDWPDNARELERVLQVAEGRRAGTEIELEDLPEDVAEALNPDLRGGYHEEVREARRQIILNAMERARCSYSEAAEILKINRTYLHRLISNLDLRDEIAERCGGRE